MTEVDITLLKNAVPYIRRYKGKTFVIKLGGEICQPGKPLLNLIEQFGLLYQLGVKLIIVHGGGPQGDKLANDLGVENEKVNGRRVTSKEMVEVAKMSFAGSVNTNLVSHLNAQHIPAIGMSGIDGQIVKAKRRGPLNDVDYGEVGEIESIDIEMLQHILNGGGVPVICSLVNDENGNVLNINADTLAAHLAEAVNATKYCLLTQVDGVMRDLNDQSTLYSELTAQQASELINDGTIQGGMHAKIENCLEALSRGVPRAHITNGLKPDAFLKEIFTNEGCGTLIVNEPS